MPELPDIVVYLEALRPRAQGKRLEGVRLATCLPTLPRTFLLFTLWCIRTLWRGAILGGLYWAIALILGGLRSPRSPIPIGIFIFGLASLILLM